MLAESRETVAEEWAIHDYDEFAGVRLGSGRTWRAFVSWQLRSLPMVQPSQPGTAAPTLTAA
jgi:hypothetical protein